MGPKFREPRCDECVHAMNSPCEDPSCHAQHLLCMRYPPQAVLVPVAPKRLREFFIPQYTVRYVPIGVPADNYCGEFEPRAVFGHDNQN